MRVISSTTRKIVFCTYAHDVRREKKNPRGNLYFLPAVANTRRARTATDRLRVSNVRVISMRGEVVLVATSATTTTFRRAPRCKNYGLWNRRKKRSRLRSRAAKTILFRIDNRYFSVVSTVLGTEYIADTLTYWVNMRPSTGITFTGGQRLTSYVTQNFGTIFYAREMCPIKRRKKKIRKRTF